MTRDGDNTPQGLETRRAPAFCKFSYNSFIFDVTNYFLQVIYATTMKNWPNDGGMHHRGSRRVELEPLLFVSFLFSIFIYYTNIYLQDRLREYDEKKTK